MPQNVTVTWRGAEYSKASTENAALGLSLAAEFLLGKVVPETPEDRGTLRTSEQAVHATADDLESAVTADTPYAVRQHEELDYHHEVGRAKYLEGPFEENQDELMKIIAAQIGETGG
jgi:hypothetical protein